MTPRALLGIGLALAASLAHADRYVVIVEGLGGEPRYAEQFDIQVTAIETAAKTLTSSDRIRVFRAADATREALLGYFGSLAAALTTADQVAVYLIGHGSYDEYDYKFNIKGPDLTGQDLTQILDGLPGSQQLLVNTSSSSGAVADQLKSDDRLVILATRSGAERHATRFGAHFAAALADPQADTDKNQLVTAQEAFDYAVRRVSDYFERNDQLSTEHARIEGALADRFALARLGAASASPGGDRELAELLATRESLHASIDALRLSRDGMPADEYRARLLEQMLELARVEDALEQREQEIDGNE
ncbi:MAG: hypothetical protein OEO82_02465 [Gammaproteobacteria bacterium]|nr:hypothetical protein [Gammaproteobacteria bacterium]